MEFKAIVDYDDYGRNWSATLKNKEMNKKGNT